MKLLPEMGQWFELSVIWMIPGLNDIYFQKYPTHCFLLFIHFRIRNFFPEVAYRCVSCYLNDYRPKYFLEIMLTEQYIYDKYYSYMFHIYIYIYIYTYIYCPGQHYFQYIFRQKNDGPFKTNEKNYAFLIADFVSFYREMKTTGKFQKIFISYLP